MLFERLILKDNPDTENILSGSQPLNALECARLKAHCITWSSLCYGEGDFLAVGGARGEITLWKFTRDRGLCYEDSWHLSQNGGGTISHLAWSPWISDSTTSLAPTNQVVSILAASTFEGSVHLAFLSTSGSKQQDSDTDSDHIVIQEHSTCELFPEHRLAATKLVWKKRKDGFVLAVSRNSSLHLSIHPFHVLPSLSSNKVSCRHKSYSRTIGKYLLSST
jgi:hypothetical protein